MKYLLNMPHHVEKCSFRHVESREVLWHVAPLSACVRIRTDSRGLQVPDVLVPTTRGDGYMPINYAVKSNWGDSAAILALREYVRKHRAVLNAELERHGWRIDEDGRVGQVARPSEGGGVNQ